MVSVTRKNQRRIIWGGQNSLRQLKIDIEISKDNIFFINHIAAGSTQAKSYLFKLDM